MLATVSASCERGGSMYVYKRKWHKKLSKRTLSLLVTTIMFGNQGCHNCHLQGSRITLSISNICLGDLLDDKPEPRHYVPDQSVWSHLCISVIHILARFRPQKICSEFFNYILQYFSYFMGGLLIKFLTFTDWDLTQSDVTIFIRIASYPLCSFSQSPAEIKRKPEI